MMQPHMLASSGSLTKAQRRVPDDEKNCLVDIEALISVGDKGHEKSRLGWLRSPAAWRLLRAVVLLALALVSLRYIGHIVARLFHWAEDHVDPSSPVHMTLFVLVSLVFWVIPLPVVMQAWALAVGCFFKWKGFLVLIVAFSIGIPLSFTLGRLLAQSRSSAIENSLQQFLPQAIAYVHSLRTAVVLRPLRLSFLLMWAPLPTSLCPLLVGLLIPPKELRSEVFALGAVPSKLLHFACQVLVGLEAGSFAQALEGHQGGGGTRWAGTLAIGSLGLSVVLMGTMMWYIHSALEDIKRKQDPPTSDLSLASSIYNPAMA